MKPARLIWLARRARKMQRGEIAWRLSRALNGAVDYAHLRLLGRSIFDHPTDVGPFAFSSSSTGVLPELDWDFRPSPELVDRWLAGSVDALGFPWRWSDDPEIWHRAPDTGLLWPRRFYGLIEYRPGNDIGDGRVIWEPNRLQHLITLALTARVMPDRADQAAEMLRRQLLSWMSANPANQGVNYGSALECALRILSVSFASDLARSYLHPHRDYWAGVEKLILEHAAIINNRLSLFSSLGNHTVGEGAGLYLAALLLPEVSAATAWEARAIAALLAAARRLVLSDGGTGEQSFRYHEQTLDYLHIVIVVGRHFGRDLSELAELHRRGAEFLARISDARGQLPPIGDDDNGHALSPHLAPSWARFAQEPAKPAAALSQFTGGGYTKVALGSDEADFIMDHGPLGLPPNFAHGHSDALAIHLSLEGQPVLIDSGTFTYGGPPEWRAYFRDTKAHNTITVDGVGQARQTGPFLWSEPYDCSLRYLRSTKDAVLLVADHDGFRARGVKHTRAVWITQGRVVVLDRLAGKGEHKQNLRWHFAGRLTRADGCYFPEGLPRFRCAVSGGAVQVLDPSPTSVSGWRSERYGRKSPCGILEVRATTKLPHEFVTAFFLPSYCGNRDVGGDLDALRRVLGELEAGKTPSNDEAAPARGPREKAAAMRESLLVDG